MNTTSILTAIQRLENDQREFERMYDTLCEILGATWMFMPVKEITEKQQRRDYLAMRLQSIPDEIKALDAQLPCQAFVDMFGQELWEFYKAKYPVNKNSELIEQFHDFSMVLYPIIDPAQYFAELRATAEPMAYKVGEVKFEWWGNSKDTSTWVRLAFALEINTIYWRR